MNAGYGLKFSRNINSCQQFKLPIIQLAHIMKVFVFIACIVCFIRNLATLNYYHCNDLDPDYPYCSSKQTVEVCDERLTFCATYDFSDQDKRYTGCGNESCIEKGCAGSRFCKEPGTFGEDGSYQKLYSHGKFTVECCKGDLCNTFSSAYVCKKNLLLCI